VESYPPKPTTKKKHIHFRVAALRFCEPQGGQRSHPNFQRQEKWSQTGEILLSEIIDEKARFILPVSTEKIRPEGAS
jgi:hypothetical protein